MDSYSLGLDIGSISVNTVLVDPELQVVENHYDYNHGRPFHTLERVLSDLLDRQSARGLTLVATTGSGGRLAAELLGGRFVAASCASCRSPGWARRPSASSCLRTTAPAASASTTSSSGSYPEALKALVHLPWVDIAYDG
jgi:hypothetical protein